MDVWEFDPLDVQAYAKYNDNYRYILSVIDVFSKYVHLIPIKKKSGPTVATAFRSLFDDPKYSTGRRPIWVRTDKGKEFLNKHFQDMLRNEGGGIQFHVRRNLDLKLRSWNACTARFAIDSSNISHIDISTDVSMSCNDTVNSTVGMAPSRVTDLDVLAIWKRTEEAQGRVRAAKAATFRVGQYVRISK